jgi:hypothetical protein
MAFALTLPSFHPCSLAACEEGLLAGSPLCPWKTLSAQLGWGCKDSEDGKHSMID